MLNITLSKLEWKNSQLPRPGAVSAAPQNTATSGSFEEIIFLSLSKVLSQKLCSNISFT